jgi:cobalt-zinc-cadmium efflux system membrane fusion protein
MNPQHRTVPRRAAALLVLFTIAAAWLWAHEGHQALPSRGTSVDEEKGLVVLGPQARTALDVEVAEVTAGTLDDEVAAPAAVVAPWQRHAYASTRLGGKVTALRVQPGQQVRKGETVAEVESLELEDLRRELLDAANDFHLSEKVLTRYEDMAARGNLSEQTLLQARSRHRQNRDALDVARLKLLLLGIPEEALARILSEPDSRAVRSLPVASPIAGTVLHVHAGIGQVVEPTEHILEVVDLSQIWLRVRLLEKDLSRAAPGSPVTLRLAGVAVPAEERCAAVQVKERYLDPQTHWGTAWAELDNPEGRLLPGLFGQAKVGIPGGGTGLRVPSSALVRAGAERYVFVEEGPGQYRRRGVVLQRQRGSVIQVAPDTGLYPGDRVVTTGSHELASLFVQGVLRLSPEAERTIGLRVEPAGRRAVAETVTLTGVVDLPAGRRAVVSSRLPGNLSRIAVERDQDVRAGDVVAEVSSVEFQDLQLDLLRSHLRFQLLDDTLGRLRAASRVLPEALLRESESAWTAARQRRDSLRSKLLGVGLTPEQVRGLLERREVVAALPIRAPIAGTVVRFQAALGQSVKAETTLFEIHDLRRVNLRVHVPERQLPQVQVGQRGRVRLIADPSFAGGAVLVRKGQALGTGDRTLPFWADLAALPRIPLLPGMLARLTVAVSEHAPTLAVPVEAVLREGGIAYLFVRRPDGAFERRTVETGRDDGLFVEVLRGLAEGEPVAVHGVAELQTAHASLQ